MTHCTEKPNTHAEIIFGIDFSIWIDLKRLKCHYPRGLYSIYTNGQILF